MRVVVWDGTIEVMRDVRRPDFVMEKVDDSPRIELVIWPIDGMKRPLHICVILVVKVGNVSVGVLQPRVED